MIIVILLSFSSVSLVKSEIDSKDHQLISKSDWFSYINNYNHNQTFVVNNENSTSYNVSFSYDWVEWLYYGVNKTLASNYTYDYIYPAITSYWYHNDTWIKNVTWGHGEWNLWIYTPGISTESNISNISISKTEIEIPILIVNQTVKGKYLVWEIYNLTSGITYWYDLNSGIALKFDTNESENKWWGGVWYLVSSNSESLIKSNKQTNGFFFFSTILMLLVIINIKKKFSKIFLRN